MSLKTAITGEVQVQTHSETEQAKLKQRIDKHIEIMEFALQNSSKNCNFVLGQDTEPTLAQAVCRSQINTLSHLGNPELYTQEVEVSREAAEIITFGFKNEDRTSVDFAEIMAERRRRSQQHMDDYIAVLDCDPEVIESRKQSAMLLRTEIHPQYLDYFDALLEIDLAEGSYNVAEAEVAVTPKVRQGLGSRALEALAHLKPQALLHFM
ncbi:MAG: hypothetical protein JWN33_465 [Candidatus Saccharibacteria bacterium]|nr:hypothetical protein [Candidatus Saccharibacteria bacterium]